MRSNISPLVQLPAPSRPARRRRRRRSRARIRRTPTGVILVLVLASALTGASMLAGGPGVNRSDVTGGSVAGSAGPDTPPGPDVAADADAPPAADAPPGGSAGEPGAGTTTGGPPAAFARHEGVTLRLPVSRARGIRFTQGRRVGAVPLEPMGTLTANADPEGFDAAEVVETDEGPEFAVAAPAGRGRPPTSAAVVTASGGDWVRAPLTGEVVEVERYSRAEGIDWRVVLRPEIRPELHVTISGLHRPGVRVGEAVATGDRLGAPRVVRDGFAEVGVEMAPAPAPMTVEGEEEED